jgi:hypothetical protein
MQDVASTTKQDAFYLTSRSTVFARPVVILSRCCQTPLSSCARCTPSLTRADGGPAKSHRVDLACNRYDGGIQPSMQPVCRRLPLESLSHCSDDFTGVSSSLAIRLTASWCSADFAMTPHCLGRILPASADIRFQPDGHVLHLQHPEQQALSSGLQGPEHALWPAWILD